MKFLICGFALALSTVALLAFETGKTEITWVGHKLREVTTLRELPPDLQQALGVGKPGVSGIAERNGKYNATDVVDASLPMRRFVIAGVGDDTALVAIEHGGFVSRVEVALYAGIYRKPALDRTWMLSTPPESLLELVNFLATR